LRFGYLLLYPANFRQSHPPGLSESLFRIEKEYIKPGAKHLAGSGTTAFGTMPGISLHTELKLLTSVVGLSPRRALAAATANFGQLFGWADVAQVRAGRKADLLVVEGNPAGDISNARRIHILILNGEVLDREKLLVTGQGR
jgi:imidazolonepropionase-like amidohydrolase